MKKKTITLSENTLSNLAIIKRYSDTTSDSETIRLAISFYANYLLKEEAKVSMYKKKGISYTQQEDKSKKEEELGYYDKMRSICVNTLGGVVCDDKGRPDADGMYCKYNDYVKITDGVFEEYPDIINPLEKMESVVPTQYSNTTKKEVKEFIKNGGEFIRN